MEKQISLAAERNKNPILEVLNTHLVGAGRLLEIGSGTGQHAVYFAKHFKSMEWVTSDVVANHESIRQWLDEAQLKNLHGPEDFKIGTDDFPKGAFDFVYTANTLHIMSWEENLALFELLGKKLKAGAQVLIYGPFKYKGNFTSASNEEFDKLLISSNEKSGIRNFEDVSQQMENAGLKLLKDYEMPANNRLLVFTRSAK